MSVDQSYLDQEDRTALARTDEDDFKELKTKSLDDIFDEDFRDFAKWMRKTYTAKYPYSKMRMINKHAVVTLLKAFAVSISIYLILRIYFFDYVLYWFLPFWCFQMFWVIQKEEVCHLRSHWVVNMTGSKFWDNFVDWSMVILAGASKELIRRRHIAAHYSDIANASRITSEVWIPFNTLPPVFYLRPDLPIKIFFDKEFIAKEKLNRSQIFVEMVGIYAYMAALICEMYYLNSFYLFAFHMLPCMFFMSATVCQAVITHSGVDKRNSFDSNGLFDADTCEGLFACHLRLIGFFGDQGVFNHGIHHAFTQLPLDIVNKEYKEINEYCLKTYKHVRYNKVLAHRVHANVLSKLPPPKWYDYIIQYFCSFMIVAICTGTFIGLPVVPTFFELLAIDYRAYFGSKCLRTLHSNNSSFKGPIRC